MLHLRGKFNSNLIFQFFELSYTLWLWWTWGLFNSTGWWFEQQMLSTWKTSSLLWLSSTMEKNRRRNATNHWSLISLSPASSQSHTHHISLIVTNVAHHYSSPLLILLYAVELALVSAEYIDRNKVPLSSLSQLESTSIVHAIQISLLFHSIPFPVHFHHSFNNLDCPHHNSVAIQMIDYQIIIV